MKNLIFQYIILNDAVDTERGKIGDRNRTDVYREMADISSRSFKIYADHIGAEHFFTTEALVTKDYSDSLSCYFEVLRLIYDTDFDAYDKVLFLDTDIVCNTFENIFDVSEAEVAGVFESDIKSDQPGGYNAWDYDQKLFKDYCEKFEANDCPIVPVFPPNEPSRLMIMNTGVMVWTRDARIKAREKFDDWTKWQFGEPQKHMSINNDQPYISAQLMKHEFDVEGIDQTWNDTPTHYDDVEGKGLQSNFLHYTGGGNKKVMIDQYHRGLFKIFDY